MNGSVNINNKKAKYDYSLLDKYTCGIVLTGNEIKSIRNSNASLNNSYCEFEADELYVPFDESAEPSTPQQGEAGSSTDPLPPNTGERSPFKRVMDTFQRRNNRVVPE